MNMRRAGAGSEEQTTDLWHFIFVCLCSGSNKYILQVYASGITLLQGDQSVYQVRPPASKYSHVLTFRS
jgi:hypothetical protein